MGGIPATKDGLRCFVGASNPPYCLGARKRLPSWRVVSGLDRHFDLLAAAQRPPTSAPNETLMWNGLLTKTKKTALLLPYFAQAGFNLRDSADQMDPGLGAFPRSLDGQAPSLVKDQIMASELSKYWSEQKDIALKLYKIGLDKRQLKLRKEFKEEWARFDKKDIDEKMRARMKLEAAALDQQLKRESVFPVRFELNFSAALDAAATILPKLSKDEKNDIKKREPVLAKVQEIAQHYHIAIKHSTNDINLIDGSIVERLDTALKRILNVTDSLCKLREERNKSDAPDIAPQWKEAKDKSLKAFKKMIADPKAKLLLKEHKFDTYPFKFPNGLTPQLEKLKKTFQTDMRAFPVERDKAYKIAHLYLEEVNITEKKYQKLPTMGRDYLDVIEPLQKALENIKSDLQKSQYK